MTDLIKPNIVDFKELITNNSALKDVLSEAIFSRVVSKMQHDFTDDQKNWYIANFYMYLHYHPTNDYPINLDDSWKLLEFSTKQNAKTCLENNFILEKDYKILLMDTHKHGGHNKETIMMNTNTFKRFCLVAKTNKGKEIQDYYIKLELINNEIIKEDIEQLRKEKQQLEETNQKQHDLIMLLENKPKTCGFERYKGNVYLIADKSKPGHYKLGGSIDSHGRVLELNTASSTSSLEVVKTIPTYDQDFAEKTIHMALQPFRIQNKVKRQKLNEWFYIKTQAELLYVIATMEYCVNSIERFNITSYDDIYLYIPNVDDHISSKINILFTEQQEIESVKTLKKGWTTNLIDKGCSYDKLKKKWKVIFHYEYQQIFLGYYTEKIDAVKAYNDYALYINKKNNCNYSLNRVDGYTPNPRDIVKENADKFKSSKKYNYIGVGLNNKTNKMYATIVHNSRRIHLGTGTELQCAIMYNKQALYYNNHENGNYILNDINIENYIDVEENIAVNQRNRNDTKTSIHRGVTLLINGKYRSQIYINNKCNHLGFFDTECEAAIAYNEKILSLDEDKQKYYKLNHVTIN